MDENRVLDIMNLAYDETETIQYYSLESVFVEY